MKRSVKPAAALFVLVVFMLIVAGCSETAPEQEPPLTTKNLDELYPGDIQKVDYIEIRSGSTGELRTYTDEKQIQDWIREVRDTPFVPDPNQEGRTGFLYAVTLFVNKEVQFSFTTNSTGRHYYIHNDGLLEKIQALFESGSEGGSDSGSGSVEAKGEGAN
ncbi:hypothetical protein [Paenibacillus spongiae]|uniref:Lipoprotein n=1 Tax=Paenibacillus spongiae TaxID=2909671 RepID=A0ABY5S928_9BACL|nr:hypothetical protein [Paenibacillus spongiae]UVI29305.1 hypothetical protein L1F29_28385 [Paenibacillus spongiae]